MAPSVQRRKVWLTPTTRVPCSNAAKTRTPLEFVGVTQTPEPISAVSGPKFTILRGHVEETQTTRTERRTRFGLQMTPYVANIITLNDSAETRWSKGRWRALWARAAGCSAALVMAALCSRCGHSTLYFCPVISIYLSIFFFYSPNLSGHRLDLYHTLAHGVALVRI